ncbi:nuclear pore complex protein Nup50 isoform X1 [Amblyomma americanum]
MAKRVADKELNRDNWEEDEEPEERGQFKTADKEELGRRVIKTAKRSMQNSASSSPFTSFAFGATPPAKPTIPNTFGTTQAAKPTSSTTLVNGSAATAPLSKETQKSDSVYLRKLARLNECFVNWLEKQLNSNPCCDFTPVFRDYNRHLDEIQRRYNTKPEPTESVSTPLAINFKPSVPGTTGNFTAFLAAKADANSATPSSDSSMGDASSRSTSEIKNFSFGISTASPGTPAFSFSAKPSFGLSAVPPASTQKDSNATADSESATADSGDTSADDSGFIFKTPKGSSVSHTVSPKPGTYVFAASGLVETTVHKDAKGSDDEEYVPPKEETAPVEEKDAVYTKRCKLFQKKDDSYADKGIGILYIKPQNDKHQLLIRADTRLGNILLNIMLAPTLPISRLGKNNVALVCIPNPSVKPEGDSASPTTMLLRVRTAEDADELKSALDRYKGQAAS